MNVYASRLQFAPDAYKAIETAITRWAVERGLAEVPADQESFTHRGSAGLIRAERIIRPEVLGFGLSVTRQDPDVRDRHLRVSVGVVQEAGAVLVTILRETLDQSVRAAGALASPAMPSVLEAILAAATPVESSIGYSVACVTPRSLGFLKDDINSPERTTPILIVSQDAFSERALFDVDEAQRNLEGVAQIYLLDKHASRKCPDILGERFCVFGGSALEIAPMSRGLVGRLFRSSFIRQFRPDDFQRYLFHGIVAHATPQLAMKHVGPDEVARMRNASTVTDAIARARRFEGEAEAALALAVEEIQRAQQTNTELRLQIRDQQEIIEAQRERESSLEAKLAALHGQLRAKRSANSGTVIREPSRLTDIPEWLSLVYPESVVLTTAAEKALDDCPFVDTPRAVALFRVIAGPLREHYAGRAPIEAVIDALTPIAGTFSPRSSASTMGMSDDYDFVYEGRSVDGGAHLGLGTSRDPKRTFRVHVHYDSAKEIIAIVHAGRHLTTTAT